MAVRGAASPTRGEGAGRLPLCGRGVSHLTVRGLFGLERLDELFAGLVVGVLLPAN